MSESIGQRGPLGTNRSHARCVDGLGSEHLASTSRRTPRSSIAGMTTMGRCAASFILGCCSLDSAKTAFDSLYPPPIDAFQYVERLRKLLDVSEDQMALARLYLERLVCWSQEPVAFSAVHRLLGTAVVLAHKFDTDFPYSDRTYAAAVGVDPKELKKMQLLFLQKIDYRLMYPVC